MEATASIRSLRRHHDWPLAIIGDGVEDERRIDWPDRGYPGRWAKVNLLGLSPYDHTLFLDADTRVRGRLDVGFQALADGWDLVMVPSKPQSQPLHSLTEEDRRLTQDEVGDDWPLMLNTGVMWFGRSARMRNLFQRWKEEWLRFKGHDQGALLRALARCPVRLWLLGQAYNGGEVVEHLFGRAR